MTVTLSVVVPIYRSEQTIRELSSRVLAVFASRGIEGEIVLVNDGSPDHSWQLISQLAAENKAIRGINFARNFGQHPAILAGLNAARGSWVVVMDADLQDTPEAIGDLYYHAIAGDHDAVIARRVGQANGAVDAFTSRLFYRVLRNFAGVETGTDEGNFGIYSSRLIASVKNVGDQDFFFPTLVRWAGFKTTTLDVPRLEREQGVSAYTFSRRLNLALRVLVINSNKLLQLSITVGLIASTLAVLYGIYLIIANATGGIKVEGWTSVMVAIFFIGGAILVSNGVLGLYLGRVFDSTKNRPRYIVADELNA